MYIKQVIIQGFRSYRDQTVIEPFHKGHNVIVGRNGSGKSNFFYAIEFVLSDKYSHMEQRERLLLLHEGTGPRVITAFVEIVFDNFDHRIPIDRNEVVLRRVIGSKKDQYFLDKKMVTKQEVTNMFESAGFSKSNPYYIVRQGKINELATAADTVRLQLLKEVAGTKVYDERREQSLTMLREANGRTEKVRELLREIEDRLNTLESEKEELKKYQKLDRKRRALEYTIFNNEKDATEAKLEELNARRGSASKESKDVQMHLQQVEEEVSRASRQLQQVTLKADQYREEMDQLSSELQQLERLKTQLELKIQDLDAEVQGDDSSKLRYEEEILRLKQRINDTQKELDEQLPEYRKTKQAEETFQYELQMAEQRKKALYAKQGRSNQFASQADRDRWIEGQVESLNRIVRDKQEQSRRLEESLAGDEQKSKELETRINDFQQQLEESRRAFEEANSGFQAKRREKDQLQNRLNQLYRHDHVLQQDITACRDEVAKSEQVLRSLVGKGLLNGIDSVNKVLATFREEKRHLDAVRDYHGQLIELMACEPEYFTAVEVTAGTRLFFHVVSNDKVGTAILKEMNRRRLPGEVSFLPLNRLDDRMPNYPRSDQCVPMLNRLQYDEQYESAFRHVFAKTLICCDADKALEFSRSYNLDGVTLDGDQVSRRGALTGGYYDARRSRLEAFRAKTKQLEKLRALDDELSKHRAEMGSVDSEMVKILSELQQLEANNNASRDRYERLRHDIRAAKDDLEAIKRSHQPKERSLWSYRTQLQQYEAQLASLNQERGTELLSQLNAQDQQEVDALTDQIRRLTQQLSETTKKRIRLEADKNSRENLLNNNLMKKLQRMESQMDEFTLQERRQQLFTFSSELKDVEAKLEENQRRASNIRALMDELHDTRQQKEAELQQLQDEERNLNERISGDVKDLDKIANKQALLLKKREETNQNIQQLGLIPEVELESYKELPTKQLWKKLKETTQEMKKYTHVNKKALDQYVSFSDEREKLVKRSAELVASKEGIEQLIEQLEYKKYDTVMFTFKQVSQYFAEIFQNLVPGGAGHLVMKVGDTDWRPEGGVPVHNVDAFTGVGIRVSFAKRPDAESSANGAGPSASGATSSGTPWSASTPSSSGHEMRDMQQLSGGQKSLVALALIFAIQKCDPAPFYLFDEIDQALDPEHRANVAKMIHNLSERAQFITTTFRAELLKEANKFYGVTFQNRVSHIECVPYETALGFVEHEADVASSFAGSQTSQLGSDHHQSNNGHRDG